MPNESVIELIQKMKLSRNELRDKVAIITGAGRGIGKELAIALAWMGVKVVIAEISDNGKETEEIIKANGNEALFVKTDVSEESQMKNLANVVMKKYKQVDILVNNAITFTLGSVLDQPLTNWQKVFDVNLKGALIAIKLFLPGMLKRKSGVIVTITSDEGTAYFAPYSASKAALRSLGYSLAGEIGDNSGVSAFIFEPGMVETPGGKEAFLKLAPLYNITFEEFVKLGSVGGFEGMMPAEYSAAGFAYTIANAKKYHGQIADPFRPLGKYGLLPDSEASENRRKIPKETIAKILENAEELRIVMKAIKKETEELNFFAKKWVQRVYSKRTSLSIEDWLETISEIIEKIQGNDISTYYNRRSWLDTILTKLEKHFEKTKDDARGYIKDSVKLSEALKVIEYRKNTVRKLIESLNQI